MTKKYIFITGGASGMGKSTVQLFIDKHCCTQFDNV